MKCILEEDIRILQNRLFKHGSADLVQFCPLLIASWLAIQFPVRVGKGGGQLVGSAHARLSADWWCQSRETSRK